MVTMVIAAALQLQHEFDETGNGALVDAARHLVHQDQARLHGEPARQFQPLALAGREFAREVVALLQQVDEGQRLQRVRRAPPSCAAVLPSAPTMTFSVTVRSGKGFSFWKVRATPARLMRSGRMPVMSWPSKKTRPASSGWKFGDQVEQRRLAGTVGADDAEDLALVDIEGDVGVGGQAAIALGHAL